MAFLGAGGQIGSCGWLYLGAAVEWLWLPVSVSGGWMWLVVTVGGALTPDFSGPCFLGG